MRGAKERWEAKQIRAAEIAQRLPPGWVGAWRKIYSPHDAVIEFSRDRWIVRFNDGGPTRHTPTREKAIRMVARHFGKAPVVKTPRRVVFEEKAVIQGYRRNRIPVGWWGTYFDAHGPNDVRVRGIQTQVQTSIWRVTHKGRHVVSYTSRTTAFRDALRITPYA
jgi:hypothetical protein